MCEVWNVKCEQDLDEELKNEDYVGNLNANMLKFKPPFKVSHG